MFQKLNNNLGQYDVWMYNLILTDNMLLFDDEILL